MVSSVEGLESTMHPYWKKQLDNKILQPRDETNKESRKGEGIETELVEIIESI